MAARNFINQGSIQSVWKTCLQGNRVTFRSDPKLSMQIMQDPGVWGAPSDDAINWGRNGCEGNFSWTILKTFLPSSSRALTISAVSTWIILRVVGATWLSEQYEVVQKNKILRSKQSATKLKMITMKSEKSNIVDVRIWKEKRLRNQSFFFERESVRESIKKRRLIRHSEFCLANCKHKHEDEFLGQLFGHFPGLYCIRQNHTAAAAERWTAICVPSRS